MIGVCGGRWTGVRYINQKLQVPPTAQRAGHHACDLPNRMAGIAAIVTWATRATCSMSCGAHKTRRFLQSLFPFAAIMTSPALPTTSRLPPAGLEILPNIMVRMCIDVLIHTLSCAMFKSTRASASKRSTTIAFSLEASS